MHSCLFGITVDGFYVFLPFCHSKLNFTQGTNKPTRLPGCFHFYFLPFKSRYSATADPDIRFNPSQMNAIRDSLKAGFGEPFMLGGLPSGNQFAMENGHVTEVNQLQ